MNPPPFFVNNGICPNKREMAKVISSSVNKLHHHPKQKLKTKCDDEVNYTLHNLNPYFAPVRSNSTFTFACMLVL